MNAGLVEKIPREAHPKAVEDADGAGVPRVHRGRRVRDLIPVRPSRSRDSRARPSPFPAGGTGSRAYAPR